jgi:two-component system phosphate regulon sensor histidine kinase PhoR
MLFLAGLVSIVLIIITVIVINSSYIQSVKNAQKNIINSLHEAIIIVNSKKIIALYNNTAEKIVGISAKEAIGRQIDDILKLSNDSGIATFDSYNQAKGATEEATVNLVILREGAEKTQIAVNTEKYTMGMDTNCVLITLQDASKEKQLEEMKVDFVSMAAHELRTPLTAIRGYTSLLQMHYATQLDAPAKELLTRLLVSTTNLTNLIDNLLSVSRIERNNLTVETKPIDLSIIAKDIFLSFEQQAQTKKQHFNLNIPDKLPLVMADPFRIGQVFINLISNALNYTPEAGAIIVSIFNKASYIEVSVQDTGEGIPKDALPRLFTKFFRVSGSLEQGSKGTGLGLYITKSIVELHKGKIWAESTVGKGSTFTFTIPTATPDQLTHQEQYKDNPFLTGKNGQGIIVKKLN